MSYSQPIELIDAELERSTRASGVPLRAEDPVRLDRTMRLWRPELDVTQAVAA